MIRNILLACFISLVMVGCSTPNKIENFDEVQPGVYLATYADGSQKHFNEINRKERSKGPFMMMKSVDRVGGYKYFREVTTP